MSTCALTQKIEKMVADGFSARRIAQNLNLNFEEVRQIIKTNQFNLIKESFDDNKISTIIELYKQGVSAKQLGIKYNIDKRRIQKWAKNSGILRSLEESHRIHQVNEHIFDEIKTPEHAYWLGFLYADVYNNERKNYINLTLKEEDKNHIIKFIEFVGGDVGHIKYNIDELGNSWSYKINSKYLSQKLKSLGCPQAKSLIIKYPDWLQSSLRFHFIRGLFDGDGCLTFNKKNREYKWTIAGTKELCQSIKEIFHDVGIDINYYYISETGKNTYEIQATGNLKVNKICEYLYKNASIYLERKHVLYLILEEFNQKRKDRIFSKTCIINRQEMNTKYLTSISLEDKEQLIKPLVDFFISKGFIYPDDHEKVIREYDSLCKEEIDLTQNVINNQLRLGTYICKFFCNSFYNSYSINLPSIINAFNDPKNLELVVKNKLGYNKYKPKTINFSHQSMVDELKDLRLAAPISIFKPIIAKYICQKYSQPDDVIGDYSCGFGARLLGAVSCGRKYIGTDPLTTSELQNMVDFFKFKDVKLINLGSEYYRGEENLIDLYWSSPPYYDLERYSASLNQAYNKGEDYFYNIYWRKTLENIKFMLKPGKWFGINVNNSHIKMVEIAKEYFGNIEEEISLISQRYHFAGHKIKEEKIYMFKNQK